MQNQKSKRVEVICVACGNPFLSWPSRIADGKGKYCSKKCLRDYHSPERMFDRCVAYVGQCWIWNGPRDENGYGKLKRTGKIRMHRWSWEHFRGPIPDGLYVLHNCPNGDNKSCINPDHLWLGTHVDNIKDATKKKQMPRGERSGKAKLTDQRVRDMIHNPQISNTEFAARFGMTQGAISVCRAGKTWRHIHEKERQHLEKNSPGAAVESD